MTLQVTVSGNDHCGALQGQQNPLNTMVGAKLHPSGRWRTSGSCCHSGFWCALIEATVLESVLWELHTEGGEVLVLGARMRCRGSQGPDRRHEPGLGDTSTPDQTGATRKATAWADQRWGEHMHAAAEQNEDQTWPDQWSRCRMLPTAPVSSGMGELECVGGFLVPLLLRPNGSTRGYGRLFALGMVSLPKMPVDQVHQIRGQPIAPVLPAFLRTIRKERMQQGGGNANRFQASPKTRQLSPRLSSLATRKGSVSLMNASTSHQTMAASAASSRSKRLMAAPHLSVAVAVRVGQSDRPRVLDPVGHGGNFTFEILDGHGRGSAGTVAKVLTKFAPYVSWNLSL